MFSKVVNINPCQVQSGHLCVSLCCDVVPRSRRTRDPGDSTGRVEESNHVHLTFSEDSSYWSFTSWILTLRCVSPFGLVFIFRRVPSEPSPLSLREDHTNPPLSSLTGVTSRPGVRGSTCFRHVGHSFLSRHVRVVSGATSYLPGFHGRSLFIPCTKETLVYFGLPIGSHWRSLFWVFRDSWTYYDQESSV